MVNVQQPNLWCDPPEAFGQLTEKDNETPISRREWLWSRATTPALQVEFRAAVTQSVIALYVRQAKNALPHPKIVGRTMPLRSLVAADGRQLSFETWQRKMTGVRGLLFEDLVVISAVLPDALPSERDLRVFLDVAEKKTPPLPDWSHLGWEWPDT